MIAALLAGLSPVALGKPRPPPPPPPPQTPAEPPPPPRPAAPLAWPADAFPVLAGATETVSGDRVLARTTTSLALEFYLDALDRLDPAGVDALFVLLAADPAWRVVPTPGGRVATRVDGGPGLDGWLVRDHTCARLALTEVRDPRMTSPLVTVAPAHATTATVRAFQADAGPAPCRSWTTALVIDGGPIDVELYEAGPIDERPWTLGALQDLPGIVEDAQFSALQLAARGHGGAPPPAGPPRAAPGPLPGTVVVEDAVNAGAAGVVWLRLLDPAGAPWADDTIGPATLQLAGWSADPAQRFPVRAVVPLPPGAAATATAEWWFQPTTGPARRIARAPLPLPAR